jgi:serine/threonine protein kinase
MPSYSEESFSLGFQITPERRCQRGSTAAFRSETASITQALRSPAIARLDRSRQLCFGVDRGTCHSSTIVSVSAKLLTHMVHRLHSRQIVHRDIKKRGARQVPRVGLARQHKPFSRLFRQVLDLLPTSFATSKDAGEYKNGLRSGAERDFGFADLLRS